MSCFPCDRADSDEEHAIDVSAVLGHLPTIKIVLLGSSNVGKSSLIQRLIDNKFSDDYHPNARTFYETEVLIDNKCVKLKIYDSPSMQHPMMKQADVFLLVYSITSKASFDEIEVIRKRLGSVPLVIAGNKCDLESTRQIHREQGASYCKMLNVPFFETSAKKSFNGKRCFYECFREWMVVKSDVLRQKELDRRRRELRLHKKSKLERCQMMMCQKNGKKRSQQDPDDEGKYMVRNRDKIDDKLIRELEDVTMDIRIAIIGTHNVGKHSMVRCFIDEFGKSDKKDTYYTSMKTKESELNTQNTLGYKERLELILNVYCIEYRAREKEQKKAKYNKCIFTPSSCRSGVSRRSTMTSRSEEEVKYNLNSDLYDDLMQCDGFDFNEWHNKQLNITDIARKNDAFLFIVSMDDKQSFVQCMDIIQSVKSNEEAQYKYTKPILIVVTKWDLPRNKHELTECDIAEFAVDIGCPYILVAPDTFAKPFHRVIGSIRGYLTPNTWTKIPDLQQHSEGVSCMAQSLDGKYLFSGGADGTIRVWDIETSICIAILTYHSDVIHSISEHCITLARQWWKPCRYLITCSGDGACCVWMIFNSESKFYGVVDAHTVVNNNNIPLFVNSPRFVFKHDARIRSFVICNNNILCTVGDDKRMKLWSLIDGKLLYDSSDLDVLNKVVFVKECNKIYAASRNQCVYVWDIARALSGNKRGCSKLSGGHHDSVTQLSVCGKSQKEVYVISCDASGYIRCRDARSPHKVYWDYRRHNGCIESAAVCRINRTNHSSDTPNYDYMLCTTSRDKSARGYSIPDGEVIFNVSESETHAPRAMDCNDAYIVSAGNDRYVRCYKLQSADIKYTVHRPNIANNLRITLSWAFQRHSSPLSQTLCGKKQFKHMVFSCDEEGIILGWNMRNGECMACFGNNASRNAMINEPKRSALVQCMTVFIQFLQLTSLSFCIDAIHWGDFAQTHNPFVLCSHLLQWDIEWDIKYRNVEWIMSIVCVAVFMILFCISYRFEAILKSAFLSLFAWITISIGFIPILRNILGAFVCHHNIDSDCWSVADLTTHRNNWIYILVSIAALFVYIPTAFRMEYRSRDVAQLNCNYWFQWNHDYPHSNRIHGASLRNRSQNGNVFMIGIEKSIVIAMIAISVLYSELQCTEYMLVTLLITGSVCLCFAVLIEPRFYAHNTNIFDCALLFGVLWTNVWSLFVVNQVQIEQLTQWTPQEIDNFKTVVHLTMLIPFMLFGALLMFIRTHKHFYDEIRGDFRKKLYQRRIGFRSEDIGNEFESGNVQINMDRNNNNGNNNNGSGLRDNHLFFMYNKEEKENSNNNEDVFPPPLVLAAMKKRGVDITINHQKSSRKSTDTLSVKAKTSFSLIPLCEDECNSSRSRQEDESDEAEETSLSISDDTHTCTEDEAELMTVIHHSDRDADSSMSTNHAHVPHMVGVIDCDDLILDVRQSQRGEKEEKEKRLKRKRKKKEKKKKKKSQFLEVKAPKKAAAAPRKSSSDLKAQKFHLQLRISNHESESNNNENGGSYFDYYASIKDDAPPAAYAVSSCRSDVTAFSGIGDVPSNIGHHLFDQYP